MLSRDVGQEAGQETGRDAEQEVEQGCCKSRGRRRAGILYVDVTEDAEENIA